MKLAEALILRADCQKRIAQLKSRLLANAKVQEGDAPAETPQELIAELGRVSTELLDLIKRINRTNSATAFAEHGSISDALAERDVLALQRAALRRSGANGRDYARSLHAFGGEVHLDHQRCRDPEARG